MKEARANIGWARLVLGILAVAVYLVAGWFMLLGTRLLYFLDLSLFGLWIGLWPVEEPKIGRRLLIAFMGSLAVGIVLVVVGLAISYMKLGGFDEGGPVVYAAIIVILMGLPIMILAMIVTSIAPRVLGLK